MLRALPEDWSLWLYCCSCYWGSRFWICRCHCGHAFGMLSSSARPSPLRCVLATWKYDRRETVSQIQTQIWRISWPAYDLCQSDCLLPCLQWWMSACVQLILRMRTAYFQAGTYVVDRLLPADRLIIIVSGRLPLVPTSLFKAPIVCVCSSTSTLWNISGLSIWIMPCILCCFGVCRES